MSEVDLAKATRKYARIQPAYVSTECLSVLKPIGASERARELRGDPSHSQGDGPGEERDAPSDKLEEPDLPEDSQADAVSTVATSSDERTPIVAGAPARTRIALTASETVDAGLLMRLDRMVREIPERAAGMDAIFQPESLGWWFNRGFLIVPSRVWVDGKTRFPYVSKRKTGRWL